MGPTNSPAEAGSRGNTGEALDVRVALGGELLDGGVKRVHYHSPPL